MGTNWEDALRRRQADRSLQPQGSGGAQRAGVPGMGGGSIPYAPGATQWQANREPPRHNAQGNLNAAPQAQAAAAPQSAVQGGPPPGMGGQQGGQNPMATDPYAALKVANMLMERFRQNRMGRYRG